MSEELIIFFYDKLGLEDLSIVEQNNFFESISKYLSHGRTDEFVYNKLSELLDFLDIIGFTKSECVQIITDFPNLLNTMGDLYNKYLFLGIIENEDNTFRKNKLLNKTKDYMVSLEKIYARYRLCLEFGYNQIKWNTLVHASDLEFARIFVVGTYVKEYQKFDMVEAVYEWLSNVDIAELDMAEVKAWPVNEELVVKYESKFRKV